MKYFAAFPSIAFPQWAVDMGFKDESYGNDSCAQAVLELPYRGLDGRAQEYLILWCDYADRKQRDDRRGPRFSLRHASNTRELREGCAKEFFSGDCEPEVAEATLAMLVIFNEFRTAIPWVRFGWHMWVSQLAFKICNHYPTVSGSRSVEVWTQHAAQ